MKYNHEKTKYINYITQNKLSYFNYNLPKIYNQFQ